MIHKIIKHLPLLLLFLLTNIIMVSCSSGSRDSDNYDNQSPEEQKASILYSQGTSEMLDKNYTKALKYLMDAEKLDPENSRIQNNLGMAYYFKEKPDLAIEHIKRSIKLDPYNSDAHNNLASIYFEQKKYDLAEKEYLQVRNDLTYPYQFRTYYNLGLLKMVKGDIKLAKDFFFKSIIEEETYCPAQYKLGELFYKEKKFEKAYQYFQAASKGTCIQNSAPKYYQGMSLLELNKVYKAKKVFEEILERFSEEDEHARLAKEKIKEINENKDSYLSKDFTAQEEEVKERNGENKTQAKKPEIKYETSTF